MTAELDAETLRETSLSAVRIAFASNSNGIDPLLAIGRGRRIFIEQMQRIRPTFSDEFEATTGLSLEDHYALSTAIGTFYLDRTPEKVCESNGRLAGIMRDDHFESFQPKLGKLHKAYLNCSSLSPNELAASLWSNQASSISQSHWKDYRELRGRPILRSGDGRSIVLDPVFFAESATVGPLFTVLKQTRDKNKLFEDFGKAFEGYSIETLRYMYPRPAAPIVDVLEHNPEGKDLQDNDVEICDACLNFFNELILFEMKSAWIDDRRADSSNASDYLSALREKYVTNSNGEKKGVSQLANSIIHLARGDWHPTSQDFGAARVVFPVLVTCDSALQEPLHCHFLANEFHKQLKSPPANEYGEMQVGRFVVTPLVLMTIDELEILQRSIENFSFAQLLRDYSRHSPARLVGLFNYLATSNYRSKLLGPGFVAESTLSALDRVGQLLGRTGGE